MRLVRICCEGDVEVASNLAGESLASVWDLGTIAPQIPMLRQEEAHSYTVR